MKKTLLYIMAWAVTASVFTACSNEEDTTPSHKELTGFFPADDDNSEEAQLRRKFKDETGSYLLFTDTLSKKQVSTDAFGKPVYDIELVDVTYSMVGSNDNSYKCTYKYITDINRKKKAAEVFTEKMGKRLGKLSPFSVLLVDSISQWTLNDSYEYVLYKKNPHPTIKVNTRCFAISINGDDAFEQDDYFDSMFESILLNSLKSQSDKLEAYWAPVKEMIGTYKTTLGYEQVYDDDIARSVGFLYDWNKWFFCTTTENDLKAYISAVCTYSAEDFEAEYADYPVCIQRFYALRTYLEAQGVKLDK